MQAEDTVVVMGAVTALTQLFKWQGVPDRRGPLVVMGLSVLGVVLWGVSTEAEFTRAMIWPYFAGWLAVSTGAAGIYGFTRAFPNAITSTERPPNGPAGAGANITEKAMQGNQGN